MDGSGRSGSARRMSTKRKPHHSLDDIQKAFSTVVGLRWTDTAELSAFRLGFDEEGVVQVIQSMSHRHFYKSMTSRLDNRVWQDVYYVPTEFEELYVKFTSDPTEGFVLLSFKEK